MFRSCPSSMASWWATLWSVGVLVLSGCATGAKKPDMSILDLAYDVVLTSVPIAGVAIHAASGKPAVQTGAGFRSTTQNFCPANGGSLVRAREQFVDLCRVKGGAFDGTFCTRGVGEVPFMAKIASTGSGGCVVLTVAEPAQAADSADYITHLAAHGYQTVAARQLPGVNYPELSASTILSGADGR